MKKILFVCTGNICRSPTAHAIARQRALEFGLQNKFYFDSAGTTSHHQGEEPDSRSVAVGFKRGISFEGIFSRKIIKKDFEEFDQIFAMDRSHLSHLLRESDKKHHHKIHLFLQFCGGKNSWQDEVIDPYYGGDKGFDEVFDVIDRALEEIFDFEE